MKTIAQKFVSSPDVWENMERGTQIFGEDDNAVVRFSDSSVAMCIAGVWQAVEVLNAGVEVCACEPVIFKGECRGFRLVFANRNSTTVLAVDRVVGRD